MFTLFINYLVNFLFVSIAILLFSAPFIGTFYYQHRHRIREKKPHFNQFMELFFQSRISDWLVFCWAVSEAIFWFVIPEFLLFLLIFMRVSRKRELLVYDLSGTVIGTLLGIIISLSNSEVLQMPYIYPGMIAAVHHWYTTMGIWGLLQQPFSGVPYKVFLSQFQYTNIPVLLFILLAIAVRIGRYVIAYCVLRIIYPAIHKIVEKHYAVLLLLGVAIFTFMLMKVANLYR